MERYPVGILYGYELEPSNFFLDEVVTLNEGKGIGRSARAQRKTANYM